MPSMSEEKEKIKGEQQPMFLSNETSSYKTKIVYYKYICTSPTVCMVKNIPDSFFQDPLEDIFGQQRQRGKVNDNPNSAEFVNNFQALRVINSTHVQFEETVETQTAMNQSIEHQ